MTTENYQFNLANTSFYLLFPGFFFYHFAIAKGYIPPVLGGYFSMVSTFLIVPLAALYWKNLATDRDLLITTFIAVLALDATVSIIHFLQSKPPGYSQEMFVLSLKGVLFNVVCYLIAAQMNVTATAFVLRFILPVMALIVCFNLGDNGIFYPKKDAEPSVIEFIATYQGFARSFVASLLVTIAVHIRRQSF